MNVFRVGETTPAQSGRMAYEWTGQRQNGIDDRINSHGHKTWLRPTMPVVLAVLEVRT